MLTFGRCASRQYQRGSLGMPCHEVNRTRLVARCGQKTLIVADPISCARQRALGSGLGCGWAMLQILAGVNPAPVAASHGPDIEPCRYDGDIVFDA